MSSFFFGANNLATGAGPRATPLVRLGCVLVSVLICCAGSKSVGAQCTAPCVEIVERITRHLAQPNAAGRAGDLWGGNQTRILRTATGGVFAAFTVDGASALGSEWRVVRRTPTGWVVVGSGPSGREPVHLLRSPDDGLWLVAWPAGLPMLWKGSVDGSTVRWTSGPVPGPWVRSDWPYLSAGVSETGRLCVLQSVERTASPASSIVGCLDSEQKWTTAKYELDYRYCYSFVFPDRTGLTWVASRDERGSQLGFPTQPGQSPWVFNAIKVFHIDRVGAPLEVTLVHEEPPNAKGRPILALARDAYQDDEGRLHIAYEARGPRTNSGDYEMRYALVEHDTVRADGPVVRSVNGWTDGFFRILADRNGRVFWLYDRDSTVVLYSLDQRDLPLRNPPTPLNFQTGPISYPGAFVAAPRGGSARSDIVDVVFGVRGALYYALIRLR